MSATTDLAPEQIEDLTDVGWKCEDYPGICKVAADHAGVIHHLIYDPDKPNSKTKPNFVGNAVVLHLGQLRDDSQIEGDELMCPPGKFVFAMTQEAVELPFDVNGTLFEKPSISNLGLLFYTLGHVDAGFRGRLTCTFLNTTEKPIRLGRHEGVLNLVFSKMEKASYPRFNRDFHREPQVGIGVMEKNQTLNAAFAFTKTDFVTRNELYAWLGAMVGIVAIAVAVLLILR